MNVLIINGSPKGDKSVTKQYMLYLEKLFSKDNFTYLNVATQIKAYEKDEKLNLLKEQLSRTDLIIFSYPVYTFLAPAQLHRFIEILDENSIDFDKKFATQFTTSKHFYDVTAHNVIKECLIDLKAKYVDGLSLDMEDLLKTKGQEELINWYKFLKYQIANDVYISKNRETIKTFDYAQSISLSCKKDDSKSILVITDNIDNKSLDNMINDFINESKYKVVTYNLNDFKFKAGCLGCLKCTSNGVCQINDGFSDLLNNKINKYDSIIMAFTIKNHAISSLYKTFYDRQFVNGHRPVTAGKPTAYIVSGALSVEPTLQEYMDAKSAVGGNLNCGIISDETDTLNSIKNTCKKLEYALENKLMPCKNFYEIGGMRIFRDMIWIMRGLMKADYKFYKKNGLLDFPQKKRITMIGMLFLGKLVKNKAILKKMPNVLSDGMLMTYQKVLDKASPIE